MFMSLEVIAGVCISSPLSETSLIRAKKKFFLKLIIGRIDNDALGFEIPIPISNIIQNIEWIF